MNSCFFSILISLNKKALRKYPYTLFLILCCMGKIAAQEHEFIAIPVSVDEIVAQPDLGAYQVFEIPSNTISQYLKGKSNSNFRLSLSDSIGWNLQLSRSTIVGNNFTVRLETPSGSKVLSSHPEYFFKGTVDGAGDVRLTIKDGFIYGFINDGTTTYYIEPVLNATKADQFVVYKANDLQLQAITCGFSEAERLSTLSPSEGNIISSPLDGQCRKIKFIPIADFSMYLKFQENIDAIVTALLSNINMAESAFATLNFGNDPNKDVGTDRLMFESEQVIISTCATCDFTSNTNNTLSILTQLITVLEPQVIKPANLIYQFYSTRLLHFSDGSSIIGYAQGIPGCGFASQVLRYHSDHPASLRVLVAHETGHNLGCPHDNDVRSNVRNYIMFSGAGPNNTSFSTLPDFEGYQYSSHLTMRNTTNSWGSCVEECSSPICPEVSNLKQINHTGDSVTFTWSGSGKFVLKYRESSNPHFDSANIHEVQGNRFTIRGIKLCTVYTVGIQQLCDNGPGRIITMDFVDSAFSVDVLPVNARNTIYDLQINFTCKDCTVDDYLVEIDNRPAELIWSGNKLFTKNLFADGARHKIAAWKKGFKKTCYSEKIFTAPYFRSTSTPLIAATFDECKLPLDWKDSVVAKGIAGTPDPQWFIDEFNFYHERTVIGTFDSSCMLYYSNFRTQSSRSGARAITSLAKDIRQFQNVVLHFDYNLFSYINVANPSETLGAIIVQVFDGNAWVNVTRLKGNDVFRGPPPHRNIWDSVPPRVFVNLDQYRNENFRVRFIVSDGSVDFGKWIFIFAALDNIRVDGYPIEGDIVNDFTVFPNPSGSNWYIRFDQLAPSDLGYRLTDVAGRLLKKGSLVNYYIPSNSLARGMYLVEIYSAQKLIGVKKVLKN